MLNLLQALLKMLPAAKLLRCIITPILRSVFLPVCVFVSSVRDLRFYQNDAATAAVQIKEEEKNRNAEQKRRGTTLTKVVFANE